MPLYKSYLRGKYKLGEAYSDLYQKSVFLGSLTDCKVFYKSLTNITLSKENKKSSQEVGSLPQNNLQLLAGYGF